MSVDTAAHALIHRGSAQSWLDGKPDYNLGTLLHKCSWPVWDEKLDGDGSTITVWRNPDTSAGDLWWEPARWESVRQWQPKKAAGFFLFDFMRQLKQLELDFAAARTEVRIPWGKQFRGDQGTTDNGIIVTCKDGTRWEILGLRKATDWDRTQINLRTLAEVAKPGHYVCDSLKHVRADTRPKGSQGPKYKSDGLLRPAHLRGMVDEEIRLVIFNSAFGSKAKAAKGGWVEHKGDTIPYTPTIQRKPGSNADMIDCFTPFQLILTDAEIEQWIADENTPAHLIEGRRWYARNLRGYATDADRKPKITIRTAESGTGKKILESVGWMNPRTRDEWAAVGVLTEDDAKNLGRNILRYGTLVSH